MTTATLKNPLKTLSETSPRYLTSLLIEFKPGPNLSASVKEYLESCRQIIREKTDEGMSASRLVRLQSLMFDRLITELYKRGFEESQVMGALPGPLALFALGSYGRGEMNLYSDIDLLIIYEGKPTPALEAVIQKMLYPLWDAQLQVGYATRTVADCKKVVESDSRAMSSMLDARFLGGDREVGEKFFKFLESKFSSSKALQQFIAMKAKETQDRLKRFGGSVYVLEPNLKESEGGLRDWHLLRYYAQIALKTFSFEEWVSRGLLSSEELDQLERALDFLWEVRNRLHQRMGRSQDQLAFEHQKPIALAMGFQDSAEMLGVEKFMQAYYGHAANLNRLLGEVTRRLVKPPASALSLLKRRFKSSLNDFFWNLDATVIAKDYEALENHPIEIMRAFFLAQKNQLALDEELKSWISRHLFLVDDAYRRDPEVCGLLREMFSDLSGIGKSLWQMHDCRFLGALIPEFGEILFQTQHDAYHVYTVDTHLIKAVDELSKLKNGVYGEEFAVFKAALEEIQTPALLALGVMFHDIGKGKGGNHSEKGAVIAQTITERMGYAPEERAEVEFLVLSHLIMPHLSQRRDLEDFNLITQFAKSMGSLARLNQLFVLTWADIRAVGPEVWTPWKGTLLRHLYVKTRAVFEKGEYSSERAVDLMKQAKSKILALAKDFPNLNSTALQSYLDAMPPRYFLANKPRRILSHFELIQKQPYDGFLFEHKPDLNKNLTRLFIYTHNTPSLFEQVTGVMAANQVNILAFEQFFDSKGEALLLLKVTDQQGRVLEEARRLKSLGEDLENVLRGRVAMEKYAQLHQSQLLFRKKIAQSKAPRIEIDNDVSAYYTVIDIYANDRIGILHDIARVLTRLGLYIEVSKISTKVDQVADVFYVKDIFGQKITDAKKIAMIKESLLQAIGENG